MAEYTLHEGCDEATIAAADRAVALFTAAAMFASLSCSAFYLGEFRWALLCGALTHAFVVALTASERSFAMAEPAPAQPAGGASMHDETSDAAPMHHEAFDALVRDALDELPEFVQAELANNLCVQVSDDGHEHHAYGYYFGGTVASPEFDHLILIFRDTLLRDFAAHPHKLREQVRTTVRHEIAHHFGASERHVQRLGL